MERSGLFGQQRNRHLNQLHQPPANVNVLARFLLILTQIHGDAEMSTQICEKNPNTIRETPRLLER